MRKALLAAVFVFATITAFAQVQKAPAQSAPKTVEQRAADITAGMARNLRLTPEQTKKVAEINLVSMKEADKVFKKHKNDPKKVASEMEIITETRLSRIKDILTPLQFSQYQQRREEKMGVPKEAQTFPASGGQGSSGYNEQYNN
ncbi:hypothetical protein [Pontibacter pudoricolor]|uniref:hypothetical protein n=1 Tax=Pontibacter pudoricolor TaxID=2694930 RepID=UPI0013920B4C|nr:hypothetical protein [Pontibacter pudoricolor]